jgi:hypothetical protein
MNEPLNMSTAECREEMRKLLNYFRGEGFAPFGNDGDHDCLTPAETAIRAMRELAALRQRRRKR